MRILLVKAETVLLACFGTSDMASGQLESLGVQSAQLSVPAGHD